MNNNETMFNLIDDYLNNQLDEKTKKRFESIMAQDSVLQNKVEMTRLANVALMRNKLFEIKNLTAEIDQEEKKSQTAKKTVATLAGVALVLASAYYFTLPESVQKENTTVSETTKEVKTETKQPEAEVRKPVVGPIQENEKAGKTALPKPDAKVGVAKLDETKAEMPLAIKDGQLVEAKKEVDAEPSNGIIAEQVVAKVAQDLCAGVLIEAYVNTEKACLNEHNGRIQVSGIKGGSAPYKISVLDEKSHAQSSSNLPAGKYSVLILDENKCIKTIANVLVKEEDCRKNFEINTGLGEVLELGEASETGKLWLFDKAGNKYQVQDFEKGEQIRWNGVLPSGEILGGYFLFQIHYLSGELKTGSVTLVK